jgi:flagellar hook-associated protein 1 FlgK
MQLEGALANANSGLAAIAQGFGAISQNIANASTADYAREVSTTVDVAAGADGMGTLAQPTTRVLDAGVQSQVLAQNATVSALSTTASALSTVAAAQGATGQSQDLASLLGNLGNAFSTLLDDPSNTTQQSAVVSAAGALTGQINTLSNAYQQARQSAQNDIVSDVGTLNTTLATIGSLSQQIVTLKSEGQSTADLENQRDAAIDQAGQLAGIRFLSQPDGNVTAYTATGLSVPLDGTAPFATQPATLSAASTYPASIPAITLDGQDVTSELSSATGAGAIGANLVLRDQTLPTEQAELDEFSETLSTRFSAQGLTLFTDPAGDVPATGGSPTQANYVGYAGTVTVNPAVAANPSLVRDGTNAIAGSPTGASSFTPNPAGGPDGFSTLITRVLSYALGSDVQDGVAQPVPATTGLGAVGNLSAPYAAQPDLANQASALVGAQAADASDAQTALTNGQSLQTALAATLATGSGVSIDSEMSTMIALQNAYGANAKVITAVQAMWNTLEQMVT